MTDFTETVKQNAVLTFSVVILSSIALTFLILLYTGIFGFGKSENEKEKTRVTTSEPIVASATSTPPVVATPGKFVRVKLPMLYGAANAVSVDGKKRGCDTVYMVDAWLGPGAIQLHNTFRHFLMELLLLIFCQEIMCACINVMCDSTVLM